MITYVARKEYTNISSWGGVCQHMFPWEGYTGICCEEGYTDMYSWGKGMLTSVPKGGIC